MDVSQLVVWLTFWLKKEFPVAQRKEYVVKFAKFLETHGENSETEDIIEVNFETSSQIHRRRFNRRRNKDGEHEQQRKLVLWSCYGKTLHLKTSKRQGYSRRHEQTRIWWIFRLHSEGPSKTRIYTVSQHGSWLTVPWRSLHCAELNTFYMRCWEHQYARLLSWVYFNNLLNFSSELGLYWLTVYISLCSLVWRDSVCLVYSV